MDDFCSTKVEYENKVKIEKVKEQEGLVQK